MSDFWYWDKGRVISLIIAGGYLLIAFFFAEEFEWLKVLMFLILPLACIWFGDEMGAWEGTGSLGEGYMRSSPGIMVKFMGWMLLLFPIIFGVIKSFTK